MSNDNMRSTSMASSGFPSRKQIARTVRISATSSFPIRTTWKADIQKVEGWIIESFNPSERFIFIQ